MDSAGDPELARVQCDVIVHPQSLDGGAALRGQANNPRPVFAPTKMLFPRIAPGIEKPDHALRLRIARSHSPFFELVAERSTQAEIFENRSSARRFGYDVIYMESRECQILWRATVFASVVRGPNDFLPQFARDIRHRQGANCQMTQSDRQRSMCKAREPYRSIPPRIPPPVLPATSVLMG